MKRIFTISVAAVMALLMVLSLTACGNSTLGENCIIFIVTLLAAIQQSAITSLQVQKQAV